MATCLKKLLTACRRPPPDQHLYLLRSSFNLLKNTFSTSSTPSPSTQNPSDNNSTTSIKSKKKKKSKNLIEVAQFLPNWGIGYHMAKTHWTGVSYEITKIKLYKDGSHGKAWGIVHKNGSSPLDQVFYLAILKKPSQLLTTGLPAAEAPKKISGVHKRCWKYISSLSKATKSTPVLTNSSESTPEVEVPVA
ncbi:hypothetical protein ACFE04_014315 [Oxalis oulophora]